MNDRGLVSEERGEEENEGKNEKNLWLLEVTT